MARKTGLVAYSFFFHERGDKENKELLGHLPGEIDFIELLTDYFNERSPIIRAQAEQKVLVIGRVKRDDRTVSGILKSGGWGTVESVIDVNTLINKQPIEESDAVLWPHYFLFVAPRDSASGLLILESSGLKKIKTMLTNDFELFLQGRFPDHKVDFYPEFPRRILEEFLRGSLNRLRIVGKNAPQDWKEPLRGNRGVEEELNYEIVLKDVNNDVLKTKVARFVREREGVSQFMHIEGLDYEEIKAEYSVGDKSKVISIERPLTGGAVWHISNHDDIQWIGNGDDAGHPTVQCLENIAREFANEILAELSE